jgi:hypothetical protein
VDSGLSQQLRRENQLRNSEIEKLRHAAFRHENVAWLQVTVNYQLLMGVLDGIANLPEQSQPRRDGKFLGFAIMKQMAPRHVLHDDVRQPVIGGASIVKSGDIRVIERSQDLPLIAKSRQDRRVVGLEAQNLQGHSLAELIVVAIRQENRAHPSAAQ